MKKIKYEIFGSEKVAINIRYYCKRKGILFSEKISPNGILFTMLLTKKQEKLFNFFCEMRGW